MSSNFSFGNSGAGFGTSTPNSSSLFSASSGFSATPFPSTQTSSSATNTAFGFPTPQAPGLFSTPAPNPSFGVSMGAFSMAPNSLNATSTAVSGATSNFFSSNPSPFPNPTGTGPSLGASTPFGNFSQNQNNFSSTPSQATSLPSFGNFGGLGSNNSSSLFNSAQSTSTNNAPTNNPPSALLMTLQSNPIQVPLSYDTKISQLPENIQKIFIDFEENLQKQSLLIDEISEFSYHTMSEVQLRTQDLLQKTALLFHKLEIGENSVAKLKKLVSSDLKHAEASLRVSNRVKNPNLSNLHVDNSSFLEYIQELVFSFEERMLLYRQQISELEAHIDSIFSSNMKLSPEGLSNIMHSQYESFVSLATQVALVHDEVSSAKSEFLKYMKLFHDSEVDPFLERRREEELALKRQRIQNMNKQNSFTLSLAEQSAANPPNPLNSTTTSTPFHPSSNTPSITTNSSLQLGPPKPAFSPFPSSSSYLTPSFSSATNPTLNPVSASVSSSIPESRPVGSRTRRKR